MRDKIAVKDKSQRSRKQHELHEDKLEKTNVQ